MRVQWPARQALLLKPTLAVKRCCPADHDMVCMAFECAALNFTNSIGFEFGVF